MPKPPVSAAPLRVTYRSTHRRCGKKAQVTTVEKAPFDPVLGARIFGEIQAEGLRAAGALVERLVHLVDGPRGDPADESTPPAPSAAESAVQPWLELWHDLIERTSDTVQRLQGADVGPEGVGVRIGVDGGLAPVKPLVLSLGSTGQAAGEMWLHNGTPEDTGELMPRCGPLCGLDGSPLVCDVAIEPAVVDRLPSRSSRGFTITVDADVSAAPGTYRGLVQVSGAAAVWLPLEVVLPETPE